MTFCVDASVVIPLLLPLPSSREVRRFWIESLESAARLVAPPLLFAETTSVVRRYVYLGAVLHGEALAALGGLFTLSISPIYRQDVYLRALELARRLGHAKAYDVQYLAVAELEGAPLVTLDRGMYEGSRSLGVPARLLK